jgi:hypothetical protein
VSKSPSAEENKSAENSKLAEDNKVDDSTTDTSDCSTAYSSTDFVIQVKNTAASQN